MATMAGGWNFDLTIDSASGLSNVRKCHRKMKVYAQVSVTGPNTNDVSTWKTPVSYDGGANPKWDVKSTDPFELSERAIQRAGEGDVLLITLYCERTLRDPKYVGEVRLSLNGLFQNRHARARLELGEYNVGRVNETGCFGVMRMSYGFHRITPAETTFRGISEEWNRNNLWNQHLCAT